MLIKQSVGLNQKIIKNYFNNAYKMKGDIKLQRKPSTRRRKPKRYRTLL